jgi:uridine phosphorylase
METFHIFHLATSWQGNLSSFRRVSPPLATSLVHPYVSQPPSTQDPPPDLSSSVGEHATPRPKIKAAAAQMVFASRLSQGFITPEHVTELENWCARGVLEALRGFEIGLEVKTRLSLESFGELIYVI